MSAYISAELRRRIRERFGDCCAYCQTSATLVISIFEIEHIIPQAAGGQTEFENLCLSCPTCNRYKADRLSATDPETGDEVRLFHPQHDNWNAHFIWSDDATEIIGLTAIARATIERLRLNRPQLTDVRRMWVVAGMHPPAA